MARRIRRTSTQIQRIQHVDVVMADSVDQGLAMLVGDGAPAPSSAGSRGSESLSELEELERIQDAISGLGGAVDDLQEALDDLRESLGGFAHD